MTIHDTLTVVDGKSPPWFHNVELTRSETEELLLNGGDAYENGTYLMRLKKRFDPEEPNYILSIIFKSTVTHHAIAANGDGEITVNGKVMADPDSGAAPTNFFELFDTLSKKPKGWPVEFVTAINSSDADGAADGGGEQSTVDLTDNPLYSPTDDTPADAAEAGGDDMTPWTSDVDPETLDWYYGDKLSTAEAEDMLSDAEGNLQDGTYMMRKSKKWADDDPQYLFSIVYKSTPTHHKISYKDGFVAINQKVMHHKETDQPTKTLQGMVELLNSMPKGWPVPLMHPATNGGAGAGSISTTPAAAEPEATVADPEPEKVEDPEPEKVADPEPEKVADPEPEKVEDPEPEKVEDPEPEKVEDPEPEKVEDPEPEKAEDPEPEKVEDPEPEKVEDPEPANADDADDENYEPVNSDKERATDPEPEKVESTNDEDDGDDDDGKYEPVNSKKGKGSDSDTQVGQASYTWSQPEPLPEGVGADYALQAVDDSGGLYDLLGDTNEDESATKSMNLNTFKDSFEGLAKKWLKKVRRPSSFRYNPDKLEPPMIRVRFQSDVVEFGTLEQDGECDIFFTINQGDVDSDEILFDKDAPPTVPMAFFPGQTASQITVKAKAVRKRDGKVSDKAVFTRDLPKAKQIPLPTVTLDSASMTISMHSTIDGALIYYNWTGAPPAPAQEDFGDGLPDENLVAGSSLYNPFEPVAVPSGENCVYAMAVKKSWLASSCRVFPVDINQTPTPELTYTNGYVVVSNSVKARTFFSWTAVPTEDSTPCRSGQRLYVDTTRVGPQTFHAISIAPGSIASEVSQLTIEVSRCEPPVLEFNGNAVSITPKGNVTVYYRWDAEPITPPVPPGEEVFGFAATTDDSTTEFVPGKPVLFDSKSPDDKILFAVAVQAGAVNSKVVSVAVEVTRAPAPKIKFKDGKLYLRSDVPGSTVFFRADKSEAWIKNRFVDIAGTGEHKVYAMTNAPGMAQSTVVSTTFALPKLKDPAINFDAGTVAVTHEDANAKMYFSWNTPPNVRAGQPLPRGTEEYFIGQRIVMKAGANSDVFHVIAQAEGKLPSDVVTATAVQRGAGTKGLMRSLPALTSVSIPVVMILKKGEKVVETPSVATPVLVYDKGVISVSCATTDAQVFYDWQGDPEVPDNQLLPKQESTDDNEFGFTDSLFGSAAGFTLPIELTKAGQRELRCVGAKKGIRNSTVAVLTIQIRQVSQPSVRKAWDSNELLITSTTPDCKIYFAVDGNVPKETPEYLYDPASKPVVPWASDEDYAVDFRLKVFAAKEGEVPSSVTLFTCAKPWKDAAAPAVSLDAIKDGTHVYVPKPKKPPTPEPAEVVEETFDGFGNADEDDKEPEPPARPTVAAYVNPVTVGSGEAFASTGAAVANDGEGSGDAAGDMEPQLVDAVSPDGKTREVQIDKGDGKLGLTLAGPKNADDSRVGIFITKIADDSPAAGKFEPQMRILSVDGNDCTTSSKGECVGFIRNTGQVISFVVSNGPDVEAYSAFESASTAAKAAAATPKVTEAENVEPPTEPEALSAAVEPEAPTNVNKGNKKKKSSKKGKGFTEDDIGKIVQVDGYDSQGTIRFIGAHHESGAARVGVELEAPEAKSNGKFKGHQYFECAKKHAVLVAPSKVKKVVEVAIGAPIAEASAENLGAPSAPVEAKEEPAEKAAEHALASENASSYDGMSRLQLIKLCRSRNIDYKPAGKDIDAVKALLVAADAASGESADGGDVPAAVVVEEPKADAAPPPAAVEPEKEAKAKKGSKKSSKKSGKITEQNIGDSCTVEEYACTGVIRFVGTHHETGKARVGVELSEPLAKSGGKFKGHEYFKCAKKHAVLVAPSKVKLAAATGTSDAAAIKEMPAEKAPVPGVDTAVEPPAASGEAAAFDGMSRLQLIKECRARNIDYKPAGKDVDALKALLMASDAASGGGGAPADAAPAAAASQQEAPAGTIFVELAKPMGMSLDGDEASGIKITKVKADSNAEGTGKLKVGQTIVTLNGQSCVGKSKSDVVAMVKNSEGATIVVGVTKAKAKKGSKKSSKKSGKITEQNIGDSCTVEEYACTGVIRFVGTHHETGKARVGVELSEPLAKSGGKFKGHEYFKCAKKHAVLVAPSKVTLS